MRIYLLTLEVAWSQSAISVASYGIALTAVLYSRYVLSLRSGHAQLVLQHVTVQFTNMTYTIAYTYTPIYNRYQV